MIPFRFKQFIFFLLEDDLESEYNKAKLLIKKEFSTINLIFYKL